MIHFFSLLIVSALANEPAPNVSPAEVPERIQSEAIPGSLPEFKVDKKKLAKPKKARAPIPGEEKLPPDADVETRKIMVDWSRQLGVTCQYCHNVENFKAFEKRPMRIAQAHDHWVKLLNTQGQYREGSKTGPVVDCYMCHRGKAIPDYKEKTNPF